MQQAAVKAHQERVQAYGLRAPLFETTPDDGLQPHETDFGDREVYKARLALATGSTSPLVQTDLLRQVTRVLRHTGSPDVATAANAGIAFLRDLAPQNGQEGLLATQMVATQHVALEMLRRAVLPDQPSEAVDRVIVRATRLQRLFLEQTAALAKLRGTESQQRVVVEHVHRHVHVHAHGDVPPGGGPPGQAMGNGVTALQGAASPQLPSGAGPPPIAALEAMAEATTGAEVGVAAEPHAHSPGGGGGHG